MLRRELWCLVMAGACAVACDDGASSPRTHFEGIVGEPLVEGNAVTITIDQPEVDVDVQRNGETLEVTLNGRAHAFEGVTVVNIETLDATAAVALDAHGAMTLQGDRHGVEVTGPEVVTRVQGFRHVTAGTTQPGATATLIGGAAEDTVLVMPDYAKLEGHGYSLTVDGFTEVTVEGYDGHDEAKIYDSAGDDLFTASPEESSVVYGNGITVNLLAFEDVVAISSAGVDSGLIIGTDGADIYGGNQLESRLVAQEQRFDAWFHDMTFVDVVAGFGRDEARIWDSAGDDLLVVDAFESELVAPTFGIGVNDFDLVTVYGTGGGHNELQTRAVPAYTLELGEGWTDGG